MDLDLAIAIVAVVGLIGLSLAVGRAAGARKQPGRSQGHGPFEGVTDVIDGSIGMYVVRRLTGRPTVRPTEAVTPTMRLSADELAYRIGAVDAPEPSVAPAPSVVPITHAAAIAAAARSYGANSATAAAARAAAGDPAVEADDAGADRTPPARARQRLVRDAGIALIGLSIVGIVAILVLPQGTTGRPAGSQSGVGVASVTPEPSGDGPALGVGQPTPEGTPQAPPAAAVTSAQPTAFAPTPTLRVTRPTTEATPKPTPKPTPGSTSNPTAVPTSEPTPDPTATSVAAPTATPVATPTPIAPHAVIGASCSGDTVDFTGSGSTGATSYLWDFADGGSTVADPSHTYGADGSYNVILTVDGPGGPADSASTVIVVPC